MRFRDNPPLMPFSPSPILEGFLDQPIGTEYKQSGATGNIIMFQPDGKRYMYNPSDGSITRMTDAPGTLPPPSPKPATVADRPPIIDDLEDEDDRDLAQLITNITFKGSITPQEIVALIRDQGWVPGADYQRVRVKLQETEDKLSRLHRDGVFPSDQLPADEKEETDRERQSKMRFSRGGFVAEGPPVTVYQPFTLVGVSEQSIADRVKWAIDTKITSV